MIDSLGTQGGRRYTQMRSVRSVVNRFRSVGTLISIVVGWIKRTPQGDPISWNKRDLGTGNITIGGSSNSFHIGPLSNFIFWSPRFLNFGTVVGGLDVWNKRARGTDGWNRR